MRGVEILDFVIVGSKLVILFWVEVWVRKKVENLADFQT